MRHSFHQIPEFAFNEVKTKALILSYLKQLANFSYCSIKEIGNSGLIVDIGVSSTKVNIAFRADIDGLKLHEESKVDYHSKHDGLMHACGHDSHITIIIAIIEICLENIEMIMNKTCSYGFRFIFQPAEEIGKGALEMIKNGCLDGISEIYGIHNTPPLMINEIGTIDGAMMARTDKFCIKITNDSDRDINEVMKCACNVAHLINQIDTKGKVTLSICGMNYNITADNKAEIKGTMRTYDNILGDKFLEDIKCICENIGKIYNCLLTTEFNSTKALINNTKCTNNIKKVINESNGKYTLNTNGLPSMASDDFAYYLQHIPGNYFGFGINETESKCITNNVHSSHYIYNDNATIFAISFIVQLINTRCSLFLQNNNY